MVRKAKSYLGDNTWNISIRKMQRIFQDKCHRISPMFAVHGITILDIKDIDLLYPIHCDFYT